MSVTAMPSIAPLFRSASVGRRRPQVRPAHDRLRLWTSRRAAVTRIGMFGLVLLNVVGLGGCHHSASLLDNSQFMEAWHTYLLCRGSAEPEEIRVDLQRINVLSGRHAESLRNHSSILLLPIAMRSLVAPLPSRIVVDPQAMATACALHAGHVAHSAERPEFSVELLTGVLTPREGSPTAILPFSLVLGSSARNRALISRGGHRTHDPSDSGR